MIVGLVPYTWDKDTMIARFEETESLIKTYGGSVYAAISQNASRADNATYIGKGKSEEIADMIFKERIDIVVLNDTVRPGQIYNLQNMFSVNNPKIQVWDRLDLILNIFEKHASTAEAKLQIKLADIRHMGPLIYGMGNILSRQGGGIGTRGVGETNTELMKRHFRQEIGNIRKELEKMVINRKSQLERRKRDGLPTISLVGYTNAGKTSLFNSLGNKNNQVDNALFATLDSSVCKIFLPSRKIEIYLTDTIGFIQNLPPSLIDAFKSTLLETVNCDLILHVIDTSDPRMDEKILTVDHILNTLSINSKNQIYVFNKIDICPNKDRENLRKRYSQFHPQFVSAKYGFGRHELITEIEKNWNKSW